MRLRDRVVGTLNLFLAQSGGLSSVNRAIAQALADAATIAVLQDSAARDARATVAQCQHALNSRVAIEQAKGVLSEREGISTEEAFARIRATARNHRLKLSVLASGIVQRTVPDPVMTEMARPDARGRFAAPTTG
jgi:hypothetical protein